MTTNKAGMGKINAVLLASIAKLKHTAIAKARQRLGETIHFQKAMVTNKVVSVAPPSKVATLECAKNRGEQANKTTLKIPLNTLNSSAKKANKTNEVKTENPILTRRAARKLRIIRSGG